MAATFPWLGAFLLATPAFGLAVGAGVVGFDGAAGIGLAVASVVYLIVDLFVLQPAVFGGDEGSGPDGAALGFLEKALALATVEDVAQEFGKALTRGIGAKRALLLAPGKDGSIRVMAAAGDRPATAENLGDTSQAFFWLGDWGEPLYRAQLAELAELAEGARDTASLMDSLGCDLLLPLRHRGLLLGLGLVAQPPGIHPGVLHSFYVAMRAYTTAAVANTFLDASARGRSQLSARFDLANAMQESLMPDERPVRRKGFELRGLFRPVAECGGDLWAWRELPGGKVLLVIGDATGHGAAPALLAGVAKGALDAHWQMSLEQMDPAELLTALNRAVHRTGRKRYMMTMFAAVVDTRARTIQFANAGQNFPYLMRRAGDKIEALVARGNSLGSAAEAHFESKQRELGPGDKILFYTDGITEAGSPVMEPWGERRFRAAITAMARERVTRWPEILVTEVERYLGGVEPADDITILAFQLAEEG